MLPGGLTIAVSKFNGRSTACTASGLEIQKEQANEPTNSLESHFCFSQEILVKENLYIMLTIRKCESSTNSNKSLLRANEELTGHKNTQPFTIG